jgi:hypothetical protein
MSIAFLPALPRLFLAAGFVGRIRAIPTQRDSIGIKDQDAVLIERDFLGLPRAFVAVMQVELLEAGLIC